LEAGEQSGCLTIGTVGRLDAVKNQVALVEALAALRPRFPALRLIVVGDGPLRDVLAAKAAERGLASVVELTGTRQDTPEFLRRMNVFALPSLNEGISNTILEAMATGRPVVAARVGGNPELVQEGSTGVLYDPAEPKALETALLSYLTDPARARAHGRAGRQRVVQNFSLEAMVQRYQAFYDELLSAPSLHARGERAGVRG
jgi:glycosyltransferase involved in cell wall biosynthesis